jgi:hypothetical protein
LDVLRLLRGERRPDGIIERVHELECIAEAAALPYGAKRS